MQVMYSIQCILFSDLKQTLYDLLLQNSTQIVIIICHSGPLGNVGHREECKILSINGDISLLSLSLKLSYTKHLCYVNTNRFPPFE